MKKPGTKAQLIDTCIIVITMYGSASRPLLPSAGLNANLNATRYNTSRFPMFNRYKHMSMPVAPIQSAAASCASSPTFPLPPNPLKATATAYLSNKKPLPRSTAKHREKKLLKCLNNHLHYFGGVPYYNHSIMGPKRGNPRQPRCLLCCLLLQLSLGRDVARIIYPLQGLFICTLAGFVYLRFRV